MAIERTTQTRTAPRGQQQQHWANAHAPTGAGQAPSGPIHSGPQSAAVASLAPPSASSGPQQANGPPSLGWPTRPGAPMAARWPLAGDPRSSPSSTTVASRQNEMDLIKSVSRANPWHWNEADASTECVIIDNKLTVCIHPNCSESAAACRGSQPFKSNGNYYYWELLVLDKTYGTSVMFGLCTKRQRLHLFDYCNLIGLDENGWSLSHKGLIWHNGTHRQYTQMFPTNQAVKIGLLFDTMRGELSYFMDGNNLGVAFCGLNDLEEDLYPVVGSTAKCTRISIVASYCGYVSLLERSCFTVIKHSRNSDKLIEYLNHYQLPNNLINYLTQANEACASLTAIKTIKNGTNLQEAKGRNNNEDNNNNNYGTQHQVQSC